MDSESGRAERPANVPNDATDRSRSSGTGRGSAATAVRPRVLRTLPGNPSPHDEPIRDVWSWHGRKYRVRAIVLLALNFLLFCGLCVFTHWLHTAQAFDFSLESYLRPFRFWGEQTVSLNNFLLYPIDVVQTPIHGVVLGLLVASMVAVPIAVAILYRFATALPFAAAVLVLGHMPWLSLTLVLSCLLAAVKPFRLNFRFAAALVGLLPVLLYLIMATRAPDAQLGAYASPELRPLLLAPWVIALLAASLMLGVMLLIASMVRYRPGAVAPVLAGMLATPTIMFHAQVGADELAYRVLEREYGPQAEPFQPVTDATGDIQRLMRGFDPARGELQQVWTGNVEPILRRGVRSFVIDLFERRAAADLACEQFLADHPNSRYIPNVLYIQARALDTRLYEEALRSSMTRELYFDFPHPQSARPWAVLWSQYGDSPLAVAAAVRLAQLHLRAGELDAATDRLEPVVERAAALLAAPTGENAGNGGRNGRLLAPAPPEASLAFEPEPYVTEAQRLLELIAANRDDPLYGSAPLQGLATLDPRRVGGYQQQLLHLIERYKDSTLQDNLVVQWAGSFAAPEDRAAKLRACLAAYPDGDAAPEAAFRLAGLEIQTLRSDVLDYREHGLARMRRLAQQHPDTIWGKLAAERVDVLEPSPQPTEDAAS